MKKTAIFVINFLLLNSYAIAKTSVHDNNICFTNAYINKVDLKDESITEGQPFDSVSLTRNNYSCIDVKAGRHGSKAPVDMVKDAFYKSNIEWVRDNMAIGIYGADVPKELNFIVQLDLNVSLDFQTYTCRDIYFGQGDGDGAVTANIWWIFANNDNKDSTIICDSDSINKPVNIEVSWDSFASVGIYHHLFKLKVKK